MAIVLLWKKNYIRFRCHIYNMSSSVSYELLENDFIEYFNKNKN